MIATLIASAFLSSIALNVTSDGLGVKAMTVVPKIPGPGEDRPRVPPMLRVVEVEPGKPGDVTGLKPGDMILGVTAYDVTRPEDVSYPPITIKDFERFPYTNVPANTVQSILVYRPSLDSTAEFPVRFSGEPAPWPSGSLGVIVMDIPLRGIPENRPGKTSRVEVIRVHPYSLADRLGILPWDVLVSVIVGGDVDDKGLEKMPMSTNIESVDGLKKTLDLIRSDARITAVTLTVGRGPETLRFPVPGAKLR
jgi:S1-C subfamily serine protease